MPTEKGPGTLSLYFSGRKEKKRRQCPHSPKLKPRSPRRQVLGVPQFCCVQGKHATSTWGGNRFFRYVQRIWNVYPDLSNFILFPLKKYFARCFLPFPALTFVGHSTFPTGLCTGSRTHMLFSHSSLYRRIGVTNATTFKITRTRTIPCEREKCRRCPLNPPTGNRGGFPTKVVLENKKRRWRLYRGSNLKYQNRTN